MEPANDLMILIAELAVGFVGFAALASLLGKSPTRQRLGLIGSAFGTWSRLGLPLL
jgi:hypothetical protein